MRQILRICGIVGIRFDHFKQIRFHHVELKRDALVSMMRGINFLVAKDKAFTQLMNYELHRSSGRPRRARKVQQRDSIPVPGWRMRVTAGPL